MSKEQQRSVQQELDKLVSYSGRRRTQKGQDMWDFDNYRVIWETNPPHIHVQYNSPEAMNELDQYTKKLVR